MTTIALPVLGLLVVIVLLLIAGLILWQRRIGAQTECIQEIHSRMRELENALEELKQQQTEFFGKQQDCSDCLEKQSPGETEGAAGFGQSARAADRSEDLPAEQAGETSINMEMPEVSQSDGKPDDSGEDVIARKEQMEEEFPKRCGDTPEPSIYNTGKSGKIYTEEELELLIKE